MRKIQFSLLLCLLIFATGCPKYKPEPVDLNNSKSFVTKLNIYFADQQTKYRAALNSVPDGPVKAKAIRNQFIEDVLPYIDEVYTDFITDIQAGRDRTNFIADLVELGASAAVGITNGERPLQIIGVGLTAFRGGRRSADLNFYKEQTTPILINKMDGNRAKVRAMILTREKEGVDTYPIGAAIGDIVAYYNAGTLVRAFTELQKDTAVQTRQSEDNLQLLKGVPLTPEATPDFRNLSVGASDVLQGLFTDLNDPAKKDAATKKLQNIVAALEKDKDVAEVLKNADVSSKDTDGIKIRDALIEIRESAALVNNTDLLNKINQAIVDNGK
jgi:hypothetical protein